jgi:hypothetical protein
MIGPDDVIVPAPRVAFRRIAEQVVLVTPEDNTLITLNETGSAVWGSLDGRTVGEVARAIESEFDVTPAKALEDVRAFLEPFLERGLLTRSPG